MFVYVGATRSAAKAPEREERNDGCSEEVPERCVQVYAVNR